MISKELITEALRMYPQYSINDKCTGNVQYRSGSNIVHFEVNKAGMQQINTYELAHKCKEWAMLEKNNTTMINSAVIEANMGIASIRSDNGEILFCEVADTEPETIFKACEWILQQKG